MHPCHTCSLPSPSTNNPGRTAPTADRQPDDRSLHGTPAVAIPDDGGLALIGDAERHRRRSNFCDRLPRGGDGGVEDLIRVVLDPPRLWEELRDLAISARCDLPVLANHEARDTGGSGVNREDVARARSHMEHGEFRGR